MPGATSVEPSSEARQVATFFWSGEPRFRGILVTVGLKYTMFSPDGTAVRATASVEVKQADRLHFKGVGKEENKKAAAKKQPDCSAS